MSATSFDDREGRGRGEYATVLPGRTQDKEKERKV